MRSSAFLIPPPDPINAKDFAPFLGAGYKLYWARLHAYHLSDIWESTTERHFAAAAGGDVDLPYPLAGNLLTPPLAVEIPLHFGDCIRNLRSALDYLVSQMARAENLSDKQTIFPFAEKLSTLKANFEPETAGTEHRKGRKAGSLYNLSRKYPDLEDVILEDIRPCCKEHGGHPFGDLLWRVITSDNIDKHRLMVPTTHRTSVNRVVASNHSSIMDIGFVGHSPIIFPDNVYLNEDADFTLDILIKEPATLAGKPVTSTLVEACEAVAQVIEIFREKFKIPVC